MTSLLHVVRRVVVAAVVPAVVHAIVAGGVARPVRGQESGPVCVVQNLAPLPRREVVAVVVPFARGAVADTPALVAKGHETATAWQPFGARWPDGSLRQALCLFPCELPALGELRVELVAPPEPTPGGDAPGGNTAGGGAADGAATGPAAAPRAAPGAHVVFVATTADGEVRVEPEPVAVLEHNAQRVVELRRARLGATGLVVELIVAQGRGDAHAYADVAVFFSDPRTPAMQVALRELAIETTGMALLLRHGSRFGVQQQTTASGSRVVLLRDAVLGDGQGIRRAGALVPKLRGDGSIEDATVQAAAVCPPLAATTWSGTGAFGAFGEPAPLPAWLQGPHLRDVLARRHGAFVAAGRAGGDPFAAGPFSLAKNAGQTGDQMDFGAVKLSVVAASGIPSFLLEVEPSVLQEACRPVHVFEADGSMVLAKDHPDWVVWSGRTHWHAGVSPDRLGKPVPEPAFEAHGWTGKDRQHWSSNHLGAFAQLTGAHWARRELAHEVQLYLAGQTIRPELSTSGAGTPRGAGRTLLAACWMWLATGDPALLQRMNERIDRVHLPSWAGRELAEGKVRPFEVAEPDARMLQGKARFWTPWQDALAAIGFAAAFRVTGNANARLLAEELALNVVRHGFLLQNDECIVATAMRWQDGEPLTPEQLRDPAAVLWSYGTGFNEWAIGAVEIARVTATARGDAALAERATAILRRIRGSRTPPRDGFIDRLGEWDAVVWEPAPR